MSELGYTLFECELDSKGFSTCPWCFEKKFFINKTGGKELVECSNVKCRKKFFIPYKSAKRMVNIELQCEICGSPIKAGYIPRRKYLSSKMGSHGTSKKVVKTRDQIVGELVCENCVSVKEETEMVEEKKGKGRKANPEKAKVDEKIVSLFNKGKVVKEIAEELSVDKKIVRRALRKNGLSSRKKKGE